MRGFKRFGSPGCCYEIGTRERERLERERERERVRESEKESYLREERQRWFHQAREIGERGGSKDSVHPAVVTRERVT